MYFDRALDDLRRRVIQRTKRRKHDQPGCKKGLVPKLLNHGSREGFDR
jgi:hypothetical protein